MYNLSDYGSIIYVGQQSDNAISISGSGIDKQHLVLDCRQRPYRVMLLSRLGNTSLEGQPLVPHISTPIHSTPASIQLADYELILIDDLPFVDQLPLAEPETSVPIQPDPEPASPAPSPPASKTEKTRPVPNVGYPPSSASSHSAPPESEPPPGFIPPGNGDNSPADDPEGAITTEFVNLPDPVSRKLSVDPGEKIEFEIKITNTGNLVADFKIEINDLSQHWYIIHYPTEFAENRAIKLFSGESRTVQITCNPPRHPTSQAGEYPFNIIVHSPGTYRGTSRLSATLVVHPYYDFRLQDLQPKKETIGSWKKENQSETIITVVNEGNSITNFLVEGYDDERGCNYEFYDIPGEPAALTGQATIRVAPKESDQSSEEVFSHIAQIPIRIIPHSRLTFPPPRTHHFTISVTPLEGSQRQRALRGELKQKPRFDYIPIILGVIGLLFLCAFCSISTFRPSIESFWINGAVTETKIKPGTPIALEWDASRLTDLRIEPDIGKLDSRTGRYEATPMTTTVYELKAENLLSDILPFLRRTEERRVIVDEIKPTIEEFEISQEEVMLGKQFTLTWKVDNADELILTTNGVAKTIPTTEHTGQIVETANQDITYGLEARNRYGDVQDSVDIMVRFPTPTPVPPPGVDYYTIIPPEIALGDSVEVRWKVDNVDSVTIASISSNLPSTGAEKYTPQEAGVVDLSLQAISADGKPIHLSRSVKVNSPTPLPTLTGTPAAPVIDFRAGQTDFVVGGEEDDDDPTQANLYWEVEGTVTALEIRNQDNAVLYNNLLATGNMEVPIDEDSTIFTMVARNHDIESRKSAILDIRTATPSPTPTPTPTATATPLPPPEIFFKAEGVDENSNVMLISSDDDDNRKEYEVVAGSDVRLVWVAKDATDVTLHGFGPQAADGSQIVANVTDRQSNYTLEAVNADDVRSTAYISLIGVSNEPDTLPEDFEGELVELDDGQEHHKFTWSYWGNENDIVGFQIEVVAAANAAREGDGQVIAGPNTLKPHMRDWTDKDNPAICNEYQIFVKYRDLLDDKIKESAGTNSWRSSLCP